MKSLPKLMYPIAGHECVSYLAVELPPLVIQIKEGLLIARKWARRGSDPLPAGLCVGIQQDNRMSLKFASHTFGTQRSAAD